MCMDYRNMNKATPKYDFLLPYLDVLIDSVPVKKFYSYVDSMAEFS